LYATEFVPAHTLLWRNVFGKRGTPGINVQTFSTEEGLQLAQRTCSCCAEMRARLSEVSREEAAYILDHVYGDETKVCEILDEGRLWNHSDAPNTGSSRVFAPGSPDHDYEGTYSMRDIQPGEEFLDDYGKYQYPPWLSKLRAEFGVFWDFVKGQEREKWEIKKAE
jgi:hypothetical protein